MLMGYVPNNNIADCLIKIIAHTGNNFADNDCEYRYVTTKQKSDFLTASVKGYSTLINHATILARARL